MTNEETRLMAIKTCLMLRATKHSHEKDVTREPFSFNYINNSEEKSIKIYLRDASRGKFPTVFYAYLMEGEWKYLIYRPGKWVNELEKLFNELQKTGLSEVDDSAFFKF